MNKIAGDYDEILRPFAAKQSRDANLVNASDLMQSADTDPHLTSDYH